MCKRRDFPELLSLSLEFYLLYNKEKAQIIPRPRWFLVICWQNWLHLPGLSFAPQLNLSELELLSTHLKVSKGVLQKPCYPLQPNVHKLSVKTNKQTKICCRETSDFIDIFIEGEAKKEKTGEAFWIWLGLSCWYSKYCIKLRIQK